MPQPVTYRGRKLLGLAVGDIVVESSAHKANMIPGDILVSVNGQTFKNADQFFKRLNKANIGEQLTLVVLRNGREVSLSGIAEVRPLIGPKGEKPKTLLERDARPAAEPRDISQAQ